MGRKKLKIHQTDKDNLISNLRGEIGEIISSWVLYRDLMIQIFRVRSKDGLNKMTDPTLNRFYILEDKLSDEIVARLSELAEEKIGKLNFYFASVKLNQLENETKDFCKYIEKNKFKDKRNYDISHKVLPEKWHDHKYLSIEARIILRGIAKALHLMKRFDSLHLGPSAKYLWHEMRKKRYELMSPPKVGYLLLPYMRLSNEIRIKVALEEIRIGMSKWEDIPTEINGKKVSVKACKKWGVVFLGDAFLTTQEYPLINLMSIKTQERKNPQQVSVDGKETEIKNG